MTLQLIAGNNSYVLLSEADAYLEGSIQHAAAWGALSDPDKELALVSAFRSLEREDWEGERTGVTQLTAFTIAAAGTGYAVSDLVRLDGGTFGIAVLLEVLTVGGSGEIQTAKILHTGYYTAEPASPVNTTAVTGVGSAATIVPTFSAQLGDWPRTITCMDFTVPDTTVPDDIKAAQAELAAVFAADPEQAGSVGSGSEGTGLNIKKVEAGSAKVTFFRPTTGTLFPTVTWQLISPYRDGACGGDSALGQAAFGTGDSSAFTDVCENYGLTRGYP